MSIFHNSIARHEILTGRSNESNPPDAKHIAFGVDANFVRPMGITITSLLMNNPDEEFVFHIFVNSINAADIDRLKELVEQYQTTVHLYFIDKTIFNQLPTTWQYSHATYNRFLLAEVLHGVTDRVLYLDADILCIDKIHDLFATELGDNIIAAAHDVQSDFVRNQIKKLKLNNGKYFNAGVIYIDIPKWHAHDISGKAVQLLLENYGFFNLLDQDALNVLLEGKTKFVVNKWNFMCNLEKNIKEIPADTALVHYTARAKPWHRWCIHPLAALYRQYASESLWRNVPLDEKPRSYKEMKMLGRALWHERNFLQAMYWYLKYTQGKIQEKFRWTK